VKAKPRRKAGRPPLTTRGASRTRERILDVAERAFAEHGYAGTSVHDIARLAGFATGLLNYYFGSKEKLFVEVFMRRGVPIRAERLQRLEQLRREHSGPIGIEKLVRAYLTPLLKIPRGAGVRRFLQIHSRVHMEPAKFTYALRGKVYDEATRAYAGALHEALPHLSLKTVYWRLILVAGASIYAVSSTNRLAELSGGLCDPEDLDEMLEHVTDFVCGGLLAPARA
jgi:AcrR family transcriptional regulator